MGKVIFGLTVSHLSHFLCHKPNSPSKRMFLNNRIDKTGERSLHNSVPTVSADEEGSSYSPILHTQVSSLSYLEGLSREAVRKGNSVKKSLITAKDVREPKFNSALHWPFQASFPSGVWGTWKDVCMNGGPCDTVCTRHTSAFQNRIDSCSRATGTKPQRIFHVLQWSQNQQQNKQETDISKRMKKQCVLKHMKCWDRLCPWNTTACILLSLSSLTITILRKTNPYSQVPFKKMFWSLILQTITYEVMRLNSTKLLGHLYVTQMTESL